MRATDLAPMAPISLADLTERAALQTRVDRKYVLPVGGIGELLARIAPQAKVLEIDGVRLFRYETVYFDTPELTSYRMSAHRRRRRFKVRTRTYLDSATCFLEVKTAGSRNNTVKHRLPYLTHFRSSLVPGRDFVDDVLARESMAGGGLRFAPTLATFYRRATLYLPATQSRATIDTGLVWSAVHSGDEPGTGRELALAHLAVVETKTGSTASHMDRLLWAAGHRPIRISKYATGLAALRPELPATPWRRTLRAHFVM